MLPARSRPRRKAARPTPATSSEFFSNSPGWLIPVRHSLGAVLMKQQRFAEAEQVYREDLARLPDNGWSLFGLAETLRRQSKNADEASETQAKFEKVWAKADLKITTSCLCQ